MTELEKKLPSAEEKEPAEIQQPLEEIFSRLEEIASLLENANTTLEDSVRWYQEGMGLVKACQARLNMAEKKMLQISEDGTLHEFQ